MSSKSTKSKPKSKSNKQAAPKKRSAFSFGKLPHHKRLSWRTKIPGFSRRVQLIVVAAALLVTLTMISTVVVLYAESSYNKQPPVALVGSVYNVADVMAQHPTNVLVGSDGMLKVLRPTLSRGQQTFALSACPSANDAVVKALQKRSLAVVLTVDNNPGPHQCTLAQIVQAYGRPNSSVTITGTLTDPKEVVLFYDGGVELSGPVHPVSPPQAPATVVPTTLATLPPTPCGGRTILSVVAHQDDDLLFMNPEHIHDLQSGYCLRTVYLTAGDAGLGSGYWLGREQGSEVAYDRMLGVGRLPWVERTITVSSREYIRMASPRGNSRVTLVFVRLPDGAVTGSGFSRTHYQSLARLLNGAIGTMTSVDAQSSYTRNGITDMLVDLMRYYHPDEIDTQTPINMSVSHTEHSDHMATGQLTAAAYGIYGLGALNYYTGYPIDQLPVNVGGQDLADKIAVFDAYAAHDGEVCALGCAGSPYPEWLQRQYTYTPGMAPIAPAIAPAPAPAAPLPTPDSPPASSSTDSTSGTSTQPSGPSAG